MKKLYLLFLLLIFSVLASAQGDKYLIISGATCDTDNCSHRICPDDKTDFVPMRMGCSLESGSVTVTPSEAYTPPLIPTGDGATFRVDWNDAYFEAGGTATVTVAGFFNSPCTMASFKVTVSAKPKPIIAGGQISGPSTVHRGEFHNYELLGTPEATYGYTWSIGGETVGTGKTPAIDFSNVAVGNHTLVCTPRNSCVLSDPSYTYDYPLTVLKSCNPDGAIAIEGNERINTGETRRVYLSDVVNPEDYSWTLSPGLEDMGSASSGGINVKFLYTGNYDIKATPQEPSCQDFDRSVEVMEECIPTVFSSEDIVLPAPPNQTMIVEAGCSRTFTSTRSITLKTGVEVMPGGELVLQLSTDPPADPDDDLDKNWVMNEVYDADGNVIGASKQFFDKLGRPTQSQAKSIAEGHVLASQTVYDTDGSAVLSTLPAPIFNAEFNYKEDFITNPAGAVYSHADFDLGTETGALGEVNNPKPIGLEDIGTLGWYYSHKNNLEPFTPVTTYPYGRSWTEKGPDPSVTKSAGPGDQLRMGSGKEVSTTKVRISNDPVLAHYYSVRSHFVEEPVAMANTGEGFKITSTDPNGKEGISYVNAGGQSIITAVDNGAGYDYAYVFFDALGNTVAAVAPRGVNLNDATTKPIFVTEYSYDQLGRLLSVSDHEEGTNQYVYSTDGKIRFSQNEEQRITTPPRFSYTNYDEIGRLIESGEYTMSGTDHFIFEPHTAITSAAKSVHTIVDKNGAEGALDAGRCTDVTKMHYDLQTEDFVGDALHPKQSYLYNGVAKTENENTKTWYSYDEYGQLVWMKQDIKDFGIKTVDYTYDLNGNVLEVAYQKGEEDAFYHHYSYDESFRLYQVFTSKDGETKKLQATYDYYLHGPLKRVELAEGIQGTDYIYTINGALKTINHADPAKDPGQDGSGIAHAEVAEDVFGMTLAYYEGDYEGAEYDAGELNVPGHEDQYGGAIKAVAWHNGTETDVSRVYAYDYDEKYQLSDANWGEMTGNGDYSFTEAIDNAHQEAIPAYDKHGNIQSLIRKGSVGNVLGDYTYNYPDNSNQLTSITQDGMPVVNYGYDALGRATTQTEGGVETRISYDAYGMVKEIRDNEDKLKVKFSYDDKGMRVCKEVFETPGDPVPALRTWYVRDAAGNVLSIYQEDVAGGLGAAQNEVPIYGASRLAVYKPQQQTVFYELKDHLGSVRAVIGVPEILTYSASFETGTEAAEAADFPNYYETTRLSIDRYNHTEGMNASYSTRLSGAVGEIIGLAKSLKVFPGDTINMHVFGKYFAPTNDPTTVAGDMAAALADAFELSTGTGEGAVAALEAINALFQTGPVWTESDWEDITAPKSFINYILFDTEYIPYDMGFDQIDKDALENGDDVDHDFMSVQAVATKPGYIYIYLSNENDKIVDVYFDDLLITHKHSPIVAGSDYYPFGLPMEGRQITQEDWRYGYQGAFAEQDEETGYTAFELRMYDARFGRWTSTDPYGQFWSPYVGMGNMPQMGVDPDGGYVLPTLVVKATVNISAQAVIANAAASLISSSVISSFASGACCPGPCCPESNIQGIEISEYDPRRNSFLFSPEYLDRLKPLSPYNLNLSTLHLTLPQVQLGRVAWEVAKPVVSSSINSILMVGTGVGSALINQFNVFLNEGVHPGRAYDNSLYITSPQTFNFDTWEFKSRADLLNNGLSYDQGMELIQSTTNVVLLGIPLKPVLNTASPFINTYGPHAVNFGLKIGIKSGRDAWLHSLKQKP